MKRWILILILLLFSSFVLSCARQRPQATETPSPTPTATLVIRTATPVPSPTSLPTSTPVISPTTPPTPLATSSPRPTPTLAPSGEVEYIVQAGDNLFRIALKFGTTVEAIMEANGLTTTNIYVGQKLIIPVAGTPTTGTPTTGTPTTGTPTTGTVYIVQAGDNLFRIALNFGTTVEAIMEANGLTSTTIYVGQRLIIPSGNS